MKKLFILSVFLFIGSLSFSVNANTNTTGSCKIVTGKAVTYGDTCAKALIRHKEKLDRMGLLK